VTGAGGFVGRAVSERLLDRGWSVRGFNRGAYPELAALGVEMVRGDLADASAVMAATAGCDAVFHVGAKAGIWGSDAEYHSANVVGTANVLAACREHGVPKLVYTSSPSVVHSGGHIEGGDESLPYPDHFESPYPRTKAEAERMVLAANGDGLATVALRPHLVWGPRDNHLVPKIVARAKSGRLRLVGDGSNLVDTVYIDNAADAHLAACERLGPGAGCAGRAYFISNGEPMPVRDVINGIIAAAGLPPVTSTIPVGVAVAAGKVLETLHGWFAPRREPQMTAFLARQLATAHWFDISAARKDLGWEPKVPLAEGFQRLKAWFEDRRDAGSHGTR
jgi:nucleoside-diphosphate-sugar epimerase